MGKIASKIIAQIKIKCVKPRISVPFKELTLLLLFFIFVFNGHTQVQITNGNIITETFTGYQGTSVFPSNWNLIPSDPTIFQGANQTTNTAGGWYGNNNMSFLGSGNNLFDNGANAIWKLQNISGQNLSGFNLSFKGTFWKGNRQNQCSANYPKVRVYYIISSAPTYPSISASWNPMNTCQFDSLTPNVNYINGGANLSSGNVNVNVANSQYIFIRFFHEGLSCSDNLGWDDISFTPLISNTATLFPYSPQLSGNIYTSPTSTNVPIAGFHVIPSSNASFNSITLKGALSVTADATNVRIFRDYNGDGIVNTIGGNDASVSGLGVPFVNGIFNLSLPNEVLSSPQYYLIVADFLTSPPSSSSVGVNIESFSTTLTNNNVVTFTQVTRPLLKASNSTDYFRSRISGNWDQASSWESSSDNTNWSIASRAPDVNASAITIQNGHSISIVTDVTIDKTTINTGGALRLLNNSTSTSTFDQNGILRLNNSSTTDELTIQNGALFQIVSKSVGYEDGIFYQGVNSNIIVSTGGKIMIGDGTSNHNSSHWAYIATNNYINWSNASIFEWNANLSINSNYIVGTTNLGCLTYFPSATATIPIFRYVSSATATFGSSCPSIINGVLEVVNGNFQFANSGTKTFRNGIIVSSGASITQLSSSGKINIGSGSTSDAASFGGGGTINLNFSDGLTIQSNCSATMVDNITVYSGPITVNGSLLTGSSPSFNIFGTASFTLNSGASISIGSADGISKSGPTGNIQTSSRSFDTLANYTYYGSVAQNTGNGLPTSLSANLNINNASGVTLSQKDTSSGTITFSAGVLTTTSDNLLTVTNTRNTAISGASSTSYVNGPLAWATSTSTDYVFPVGKGTTYLPLTLNATQSSTPPVKVEAFTGNCGGTTTAGCVSTTEYWKVDFNQATAGNVTVTLQRPTLINSGTLVGTSSSISGSYTSLGSGAVSGSGPYSISNSTPQSISTDSISNYYALLSPLSITAQPATPSAVCAGGTSPTLSVSATGTGTLSYQWYSNTSNSTSGGTPASSPSASSSYQPPVSTAGTTYYYVTVSSSCGSAVNSNAVAVVVNANTSITTQPATPSAVCAGGTSLTLSVTATGTGTLTYQWYSNSSNSNSGGTLVSGPLTSSSYQPPVSTAGTSYYYVVISGSCGTAVNSNAVTVVVNANTSITTQPTTPSAVCAGGTSPTLSVSATGTGTLSYQWYSNTSNSTSGGTLASASSSYQPPVSTAGTTYYYVVVTGSCGSVNSNPVSMVVNPLPTAVTVTGAGTYCESTTINASNSSSGTIYFQGTTPGGISTTTPSTSQSINTSGTYYFRAQSSAGCWGTEGSAAVVITPRPVVNGVSICAGGSGSLSTSYLCNESSPNNTPFTDAGSGSSWTPSPVTGLTISWTNPSNITTTGVATASVTNSGKTYLLKATNYNFSIPTNAIIKGMTVAINRSTSNSSTSANIKDNLVCLVKNNVLQNSIGQNKARSTLWTNTSLAEVTYGGTLDIWNNNWTATDINNANFGVALSVTNTNTSTSTITASVDYMRISVTYTLPGNLNWYTASSGGTVIGTGASFNPVGVTNSGLLNTNTAGTTAFYVECSSATNPVCRGVGNFVINEKPLKPVIITTVPTCLSVGTASIFNYSSGNTYTFTPSGPSIGADGVVSNMATGINYTVIATNTSGCSSIASDQFSISAILTTPVAPIVSTTAASCSAAGTASITNYSSDNTYAFSPSGPSVGPNGGVSFMTAGTNYTVTATNSSGCASVASSQFSVAAPLTIPSVSITNNTSNGATELTCLLTSINVAATGGTSYSWSNSLGTAATQSLTSPGTYTVTATGTNGCSSTASITITSNTTVPTAGITNNTGSSILTCSTTGISVTATGGTSYSWSNSLGTAATQSLTSTGTYTVTATGANSCTSTASITISQNITTPSTPTISPSGPTTFCSGGSVTLTSSSGSAYSWSNGASTQSITITSGGNYAVTITGTNGCISAASAFVSVSIQPQGTWLGGVSTDWSTASNWSCSTIPNSATDVVIPSGTTFSPSIISTDASCKNLTINPGAILTMSGPFNLNISGGNFTNNGSFLAGTGNVYFGQNISLSGTIYFNNVYISNGGVNFGSGSTVNGNLTINGGGYVATNAPKYSDTSKIIYNAGGVYRRNTEWNTDNPGTTRAGYPNDIVVQNNTILQLNSVDYPANFALGCSGNFTVDAGSSVTTDSMLYPISVAANLILNGTITLSKAVGKNLFIGGNFTRTSTGVFNHNDRAVVFNGSANSVITASGGQYFPYLYLSKSSVTGTLALADSISIGKEFTINTGRFALNDKNVTLLSNATSTARFGKITENEGFIDYTNNGGRFIVERYIPTGTAAGQHGKSWQFLSVPTSGDGQTIKAAWQEGATVANGNPKPGYGTQITSNIVGAIDLGFDVYTAPGPSMKTYNGTSGLWEGVPSTNNTPIYNPKGYMVFVRGDRSVTAFNAAATPTTLRTRGKLFTPNNKPDTVYAAPGNNFISIGNPYASPIEIINFDFEQNGYNPFTDMNRTIWVWDPLLSGSYGLGGYQSLTSANEYRPTAPHNTITSNYPAGKRAIIQSGQAFFMHQHPTQPIKMAFGEYVKSDSSSRNVFRETENQITKKILSICMFSGTGDDAIISDGVAVVFSPQYSNNVDYNDGLKILNPGENLAISSNGKLLSVEAKSPVSRTDTVFLYVTNLRTQNYEFRFGPENISYNDMDIYFGDRYLRTQQLIGSSDSTYITFAVTADLASKSSDRFYLIFKKKFSSLPKSVLIETAKSADNGGFISGSRKSVDLSTKAEGILISVYPNPLVNKKTMLSLSNATKGIYRCKLLNNMGQLVWEESAVIISTSWTKDLDLSTLPKGAYTLQIVNAEGIVYSDRLISQ